MNTTMKNYKIALFAGVLALVSAFVSTPFADAQYYGGTPTLSVTSQGSGNAQINVSNAPSNAQIDYYYRKQGETIWSTTITNIGRTDYSGYFSQIVSLGNDWSNGATEQYVNIGGLSSSIITVNGGGYTGCSAYGCYNSLTFSPSSPTVNVGQSQYVSIYNSGSSYSGNYYISTNSNSSVVDASISGTSLYLYGRTTGSTSITVCQSNYTSTCGTVYVTVAVSYTHLTLPTKRIV